MIKSFKIITAIILTTLLISCSSPQDDAIRDANEMFTKAAALPYIPGINVAVADETGVVWAEGFGYANNEHQSP